MQLDAKLGQVIVADVVGHSALNGAQIPDGSIATFTSNDPAVATVTPAPTTITGGFLFSLPITILALGATDIHVSVATPDGSVFEDTAQLTVSEPVPGLVRVELVLRVV